ncbi:hypothetical protein [Kiloniella litopenaei]|uniref:hypothetical protein n=1 Tax=Kiloniella litopenaei TaxID=1549748 RepID=UPI003BA9DB8E
MRKLMQHLLDGGKLEDEHGHVVTISSRQIQLKNPKSGTIIGSYEFAESFVRYLAENTLKPLYTDGLYEVQYKKDDKTSTFVMCGKGDWYPVYAQGPSIYAPHRIIRKLEPQELEL